MDREHDAARLEVIEVFERAIPKYAESFTSNLLPAVRFRRRSSNNGRPVLRLGGGAQLPVGVDWPSDGDRPLHLIAVLDLGQASAFDESQVLPDAGLLHFFYDPLGGWGLDPQDRSSWSLVCFNEAACSDAPLRRRAEHEKDRDFGWPSVLPEAHFGHPFVHWMAPGWVEPCVGSDEWPDRFSDDVIESLNLLGDLGGFDGDDIAEQVLGWPNVIQNPMQRECELASSGIYTGGDPKLAELEPDASEWRLLLQVSSWDEQGGAAWGDGCGALFVWMRELDIRLGRFDQAWVILQSG